MQETLLSPRILSYSCHTLTWHCRDASFSVDDWYFENRDHLDSDESLAQDITVSRGQWEVSRKWNTIVELYTARALTVSEDKLPALAALATVFSPVLGPTYLAGIWESALPNALLWMSHSGYPDAELRFFASGHLDRVARQKKTYRAPTWSWASTDSLVTYPDDIPEGSDICKVVECKTIPKDPLLPFGEVTSGYIKIRGRIRQRYLRPPNIPKGFHFWSDCELPADGPNQSEPPSGHPGTINIDVDEFIYERPIQCILISRISVGCWIRCNIRGLVLVVDDRNMYRRIGIFDGIEKDFEGIEEEIITII